MSTRQRYVESAPQVLRDYLIELRQSASSVEREHQNLLERLITVPAMNSVWNRLSSVARRAIMIEAENQAEYAPSDRLSRDTLSRVSDSVYFDYFRIVSEGVSSFSSLDRLSARDRRERLEELSRTLARCSRQLHSLSLDQITIHANPYVPGRMDLVRPTEVFEQLRIRVQSELVAHRLTRQNTDDAACIYFQRYVVTQFWFCCHNLLPFMTKRAYSYDQRSASDAMNES